MRHETARRQIGTKGGVGSRYSDVKGRLALLALAANHHHQPRHLVAVHFKVLTLLLPPGRKPEESGPQRNFCTFEISGGRERCTPAHWMHSTVPSEIEAQSGSAAPQSAHLQVAVGCLVESQYEGRRVLPHLTPISHQGHRTPTSARIHPPLHLGISAPLLSHFYDWTSPHT